MILLFHNTIHSLVVMNINDIEKRKENKISSDIQKFCGYVAYVTLCNRS